VTTILITGAGSGLGAYLHEYLAAQGLNVIATDITNTEVSLDVTSADACREIARTINPDIWINCAGVLGAGQAATQTDELINHVIDVNLRGVINGTRAAIEVMRQRGSGHIINIGSLASWVPVPGECVYAATKAAVLSFSLGIAGELRQQGDPNIHVSVVCPDGMLTPMLTNELDNDAIAMSFTGLRLTTPHAVALRVHRLIQHPRAIASVPRYRGALVRSLGSIPGVALRLAPMFHWLGTRQLRRVRKS
jgi:short-subunit dehydrogenase